MRTNLVRSRIIVSGILMVLIMAGMSFAASGGKKASVTIPATPELYNTQPTPLTPDQCGQCHPGLFQTIKENGGRHRFACQKCHSSFHAYNPVKANWAAIMPKCGTCHEQPHGPKITDCAGCHSNPHAPKKILATAQLATACFDCHGPVRDQLVKYPSKHTKVACTTCHTSHGYKPSCFACHKPHEKGQSITTCTTCHPVHRPTQIAYGKNVPSATCGSCHSQVYNKLVKGNSKHKAVACVTCHKDRHRFIPQCKDCHGLPHQPVIHDKFPRCLTCHVDVHDLPVMPVKNNK